jgi:hypothetical protein
LKSGLEISKNGQPFAIVVEVTSLTQRARLSSRAFFTEFSRSQVAFGELGSRGFMLPAMDTKKQGGPWTALH